jgi:hypothetical protein
MGSMLALRAPPGSFFHQRVSAMSSRILRVLAMGLCASALALGVWSCGSATSPAAPAAGGGGGSGGGGGTTGTGSGSGNVGVDFSACSAAQQPLWFAYQDGSGAWTTATASNHVYRFNITQSKGGFAWATTDSSGQIQTTAWFYTKSELTTFSFKFCPVEGGPNSMGGTVAGLDSGQVANIALAGGWAEALYPQTTYGLSNMLSGSYDLVAWETGVFGASASDKVIIRRNVAVQNFGLVPLVDFSSAEAQSAATGTITVANAGGGTLTAEMSYATGSNCTGSGLLYFLYPSTSPFTAYGVPASLQNPSDVHELTVGVSNGNNVRGVFDVFHAMGNRTETFPPAISPTVSVLSGSYKRLQAVFTQSTDYDGGTSMSYYDAGNAHALSMSESAGYVADTSVTLTAPDFSQASGFSATWEPATGAATTWVVETYGGTITNPTLCQSGGQNVSDSVTGSN